MYIKYKTTYSMVFFIHLFTDLAIVDNILIGLDNNSLGFPSSTMQPESNIITLS